jgi:hypothetical protein
VRVITSEYAGLSIHRRALIYADLSDSDICEALAIKIQSPSPLLDLCRALVEAGHDPTTPLEAYRGKTLCLRVRSIGEAAKLKIGGDGVTFRPVPEPVTAPPIRSKQQAARRAA